MGAIGLFAYLKTSEDLEALAWIPLAAIIIVTMMRAIGSLPVMMQLNNETFPTEIRTQSIGICDTLGLSTSGINLKLFPDLKNQIGFHGVFLCYTVGTLILVSWGLLTIPDNRGKSLIKVEEVYEQKNEIEEETDINKS